MLKQTFGGSGYDIACAQANKPIVYQIMNEHPIIKEVNLSEQLTKHLLFIYLGKKQNSQTEIKRFKQNKPNHTHLNEINTIIDKSMKVKSIEKFELLLDQSEDLLSPIIGKPKLKDHIFTDYKYSIKSLGAWGGDFFMATYRDLEKAKDYFRSKNLNTMFTYNEVIK